MEESNKPTNPIDNFIKKHPLSTIVGIIITTATITLGITNNLIVEHYKLTIREFESKIGEKNITISELKNTIEKKDSEILDLQQEIIRKNITIDSLKGIPSPPPPFPDPAISKKLGELITEGEKISEKDVNKKETSLEFQQWKSKCLSVISSVKNSENDVATFNNSTNLTDSNYPMMPKMIQEGIKTLEKLKGKMKTN